MNDSPCAVAAERAPKHIELHESIVGIGNVKRQAEALLFKITGRGCENTEPCAKEPTPSLTDVLNQDGASVRDQCGSISQMLEAIEDELF